MLMSRVLSDFNAPLSTYCLFSCLLKFASQYDHERWRATLAYRAEMTPAIHEDSDSGLQNYHESQNDHELQNDDGLQNETSPDTLSPFSSPSTPTIPFSRSSSNASRRQASPVSKSSPISSGSAERTTDAIGLKALLRYFGAKSS